MDVDRLERERERMEYIFVVRTIGGALGIIGEREREREGGMWRLSHISPILHPPTPPHHQQLWKRDGSMVRWGNPHLLLALTPLPPSKVSFLVSYSFRNPRQLTKEDISSTVVDNIAFLSFPSAYVCVCVFCLPYSPDFFFVDVFFSHSTI